MNSKDAPTGTPVECLVGHTVYVVGGAFGDIYANRRDAEAAVLKYIFDEHWLGRLREWEQQTLHAIRDQVDLVIRMYNQFAEKEDGWNIREVVIR